MVEEEEFLPSSRALDSIHNRAQREKHTKRPRATKHNSVTDVGGLALQRRPISVVARLSSEPENVLISKCLQLRNLLTEWPCASTKPERMSPEQAGIINKPCVARY